MTLSSDSMVRRIERVPFARLGSEALAIDAEAGVLYSLNESAGRVWDLTATPMSVGEICAQLQREYDVDGDTCRTAVEAILNSLIDAGFVQVIGVTDAAPSSD
jgi:hypothetical protein